MRSQTVLLTASALLIGGLFLVADAQARGKEQETSSIIVKTVCGNGLQSGGGAYGCTRCNGKQCTDYSCNHSGQGRQGCWKIPVTRTAPPGGGKDPRGVGNPVTGVKGVGTSGLNGKGVGGTSSYKPAGTSGFVRRK